MDERISPTSGKLLKRDIRPVELRFKDQRITVDMPGWYADDDNEDAIFSGIDMKVSDRALNTMKARHFGLLEPDEIKRIRKKLKLTQKEASEIAGGGPNAFQKYESGEVLVSRAMSNLLRLLDLRPALLEDLRKVPRTDEAA